jgi:hypothetical protein
MCIARETNDGGCTTPIPPSITRVDIRIAGQQTRSAAEAHMQWFSTKERGARCDRGHVCTQSVRVHNADTHQTRSRALLGGRSLHDPHSVRSATILTLTNCVPTRRAATRAPYSPRVCPTEAGASNPSSSDRASGNRTEQNRSDRAIPVSP